MACFLAVVAEAGTKDSKPLWHFLWPGHQGGGHKEKRAEEGRQTDKLLIIGDCKAGKAGATNFSGRLSAKMPELAFCCAREIRA